MIQAQRYPKTQNKSLQAHNAADELLLGYARDNKLENKNITLLNDRFGFLAINLLTNNVTNVVAYKSQEKALKLNQEANNTPDQALVSIAETIPKKIDFGLIKMPKSVDLFELYLVKLHSSITLKTTIVCGFMTKYFTKQTLEVASKYFEVVEQSRAEKKARLLILKKKKKVELPNCINEIAVNNKKTFKQYYGVFSANGVDKATKYLTENWQITGEEKSFLDLASGNGILAWRAKQKMPNAEVHLIDDSFLAVESSKMNMGGNVQFHCNDVLNDFADESFDLIVSNPPFHFEFENNIEVALSLFKRVRRTMTEHGSFQLVSSLHLNFKTHLEKLFKTEIVAENGKFVVYKCTHYLPYKREKVVKATN